MSAAHISGTATTPTASSVARSELILGGDRKSVV